MKSITRYSLSLILGTAFMTQAMASTETLRSEIEKRSREIVHRVDSTASVFVTVKAESISQTLPDTPFVLKSLEVTGRDGELAVKDVDVGIWGSKETLDPSVIELIQNVMPELKGKIRVSYQQLPAALRPGITSAGGGSGAQKTLFFLGIAFITMGAFFVVLMSRRTKEMIRTLEGSIAKLSESIESSAMAGGGNQTQASEAARARTQNASQGAGTRNAHEVFKEIPTVGLLAMFSDCYWTARDGVAKFLWEQFPLTERAKILDQFEPAADYVRFLQTFASERDESVENDPYYLKPLSIFGVSNDDLARQCRKIPGLYLMLPKLRREALPIGAKEAMAFAASGTGTVKGLQTLESIRSQARALEVVQKYYQLSLDEEREFLAQDPVDLSVVASVPSLGWLTKVTPEQATEIVSELSARELAQMWVGPEEILTQITAYIPAKKLKLVETYREQGTPDRRAVGFDLIQTRVSAILKTSVETQPEYAKAA